MNNLGVQINSTNIEDGTTLYFGPWASKQGNRFVQSGSFYKNKKGKEILYCKSDVLTYPAFEDKDLEDY